MAKRMLIDATHPEETRVTVVSGNRLEEFDYETETRRQLKGNIYLAKVTRVEPSLQAAFVEYGGNRHGFLAFSEIHPDYYRIPVGDREELVEEDQIDDDENGDDTESDKPVEELGGDEAVDEVEENAHRRPRLKRQYKIQEVIKRRQVLLVQVVKEERGNKGAALTTYLSLAGRYCVLMPNTSRGGGVSRKIVNPADRKRLKKILAELTMPQGMAVIVRTAGAERSRAEIKRDFDYIFKLWDDIRTRTLEASAPALIHEEANLIKRALRDLYAKDMEEILVAGDEGYRTAKNFMKSLIPSHAKKVQPYRDQAIPLFQRYQVESQLAAIHEPTVMLRSGGSIVMHQTEALVSIDVNSGKATRERHIEETALKTNLEAAEEIARQLRLRDMAGLIVIDFIDMEEGRNDQAVERKLKETLKKDRARIQVGRISPFGLLEMSRQRLRPSLLEAITQSCPHCGGTGYIQSTDSAALSVLRAIEEEGLRRRSSEITVTVNPDVALYILNNKRGVLGEMEANYGFELTILTKHDMLPAQFDMSRVESGDGRVVEVTEQPQQQPQAAKSEDSDEQQEGKGRRRRRRRRGRKRPEDQANADNENQSAEETDLQASESEDEARTDGDDDGQKKRRKRGRRGGRRRGRGRDQDQQNLNQDGDAEESRDENSDTQPAENNDQPAAAATNEEEGKSKRPRRRRGRGKDNAENQAQETVETAGSTEHAADAAPEAAATSEAANDATAEAKPQRRSRRSRKPAVPEESPAAAETADGSEASSIEAAAVEATASESDAAAPAEAEAKPAKKTRAKKARAKKASAKKTTAKKATAKKARAKKAAAKAPEAKEAPAETAPAAQTPTATESQASPAPAPAAQPAPVAAQPAASTPEPAKEEAPSGPKRKGWWSRVLGS
ncbi:Rne/Rng family ribonuclease [Aestuariispira insulae]|uniref:Ribonuclease E n=1 Tax=Aestuariispira insulae TaxID=1461337 RepID=A0A3D9HW97_9PROT|nr:ribonuclease E/G [Aestuariispira insulae]RED53661.1 RNAse E [Aestuariispira insulae]